MDGITRGPFLYEQRETAPPWSVGWLANSTATAMGQHTDDPFSGPRGETADDQGHTDEQKKKLFVGMAPKSAYEEDYRAVFAPFGALIDIYVIRDRNGFSKGCAFVRYESVKSASDAIEALHDKHIMPGGFRTLVVTIADDRRGPQTGAGTDATTRRDAGGSGDGLFRSLSRPPSFMGSDGSGGGGGGGGGGGNMPSLSSTLAGPNRSPVSAPQAGAAALAPNVVPGDQPSGVMPGMPYFLCGGNPPQGTYVYYPYVPSVPGQQETVASSVAPIVLGAKPHHAIAVGSHAGGNNIRGDLGARRVKEDGYTGDGTIRRFGTGGPEEKGRRWAKQSVGPTGANLFVYYLPGSVTDADLATAFAPFGEVLSAKVYYDRDTGESKGFGFVSYTKPEEADAAIASMNGFFIGQKRLKVVRKRGQQADRSSDSTTTNNNTKNSNNSTNGTNVRAGDLGYTGSGVVGDGSGTSNVGARSQRELDFLTPEGSLGQSLARFL